jgi:hypothetical protein
LKLSVEPIVDTIKPIDVKEEGNPSKPTIGSHRR